MKKLLPILTAIFSIHAQAACEKIEVNVADFNPTIQEAPFMAISKMTKSIAFGATHVKLAVQIQGCRVDVNFEEQRVFIMQEGSECVRSDIRAHEAIHVAIWRKHLDRLPQALQGGDLIEQFTKWQRELKADHNALDSHENYEKNYTTCDKGYIVAISPYADQIRALFLNPTKEN